MRWLVALLAVGTGVAHADGLGLGIADEHARIDRATIHLRVADDAVMARIELAVSTTETARRDLLVPLELPAGAIAIGLELGRGSEHAVSAPLAAPDAAARYRSDVEGRRDPALLEWLADGHLMLHVFPVVRGEPATVTVELELPRTASLRFDPGEWAIGRVDVDVERGATRTTAQWSALRTSKTIELGAAPAVVGAAVVARRTHVDADTSLYAGERPSLVPTVILSGPRCDCGGGGPDKGMIRRVIKRQIPVLQHCYELALGAHPTLAGTIVLRFFIAADGSVATSAIDGDLDSDEVRACIAAEPPKWTFPRGDGGTEVNYPLVFRPSS